MKVEAKQVEPAAAGTDLLVVGLLEGGELPAEIASAAGADAAKSGFKKLALLRPDGFSPVLVVGLGKGDELDTERLRIAAAVAAQETGRLEAASTAWALPEGLEPAVAADAVVTGTILASYRFDRFKSGDDDGAARLESLTLLGPVEVADAAESARIAAEAQNRARDLQSTPANFATPTDLAQRAEEIANASGALTVEVFGQA
ncbi:MAG TPA: M17 family peptidase N-terminal domain-containing protein, partial [Solirubrobacterales bacterium]|nr:M17 family peptidase N-terminal domain-containing protein [Solirubrobacterales bacterium]